MGGPASFTDEHLASVHKRLHITPEAFDEMALTLRETLEDFELDESDTAAVMSAFLSRSRLVLETRRFLMATWDRAGNLPPMTTSGATSSITGRRSDW